MTRQILRITALFATSLWMSACGGGTECFNDAECGAGFECARDGNMALGSPGLCEACPAEIPYDGLDNDCDPGTKDRDLDGDGDNWVDAPEDPGTDCEDDNPLISGRATEICTDMIDNDCDMLVDEPPCGDASAPRVMIQSPLTNSFVSASINVLVDVMDDGEIVQVEFYVGQGSAGVDMDAPYSMNVDTTAFGDGPLTIRAVATDLAGQTGEDSIIVTVDNTSGPVVTVQTPAAGTSYGGTVTLAADAVDAAAATSQRTAPGRISIAMGRRQNRRRNHDGFGRRRQLPRADRRGIEERHERWRKLPPQRRTRPRSSRPAHRTTPSHPRPSRFSRRLHQSRRQLQPRPIPPPPRHWASTRSCSGRRSL